MPTQEKPPVPPAGPRKPQKKAHTARAQVEKFVKLVQKKSISISRENQRSRVSKIDVYRALWLVTGKQMPTDRVKNLSKGRNVVKKVHVRQRRERNAKIRAVVSERFRALANQSLLTVQEADDQNMETDRSSQSEAPKSSNSVEMESAGSFGSSTGAAPASASEAAAESKTGSLDEMSVDLSAGKSQSADSMSIAEVAQEDDPVDGAANDAEQNADETLYDVEEPDSGSSASNSGENTEEIAEADGVSSKHSLEEAESLPDDDADKKDSGNEWELELTNSEDDSVEKKREISGGELAAEDTMDVVTEQLAEAVIQTERKLTPKRSSQIHEEEKPAKFRPRSSEFSPKANGRESSSPKAPPISPQIHHTPRRRSNSEPDTPAPPDGSANLTPLRRSSPTVSGRRPSPIISIVVTPPKDELKSPKE